MSKKISELEKCEKINEQSSLPILHNGETMQLLYETLVEDLKKNLNFSDFSGNYEDLENKPQNLVNATDLEGLATEEYVDRKIVISDTEPERRRLGHMD